MGLSPLKHRELMIMTLCSRLVNAQEKNDLYEIELLMHTCRVTKKWATQALKKAKVISQEEEAICRYLSSLGIELDYQRMGVVERAVLLWVIFELGMRHDFLDLVHLQRQKDLSDDFKIKEKESEENALEEQSYELKRQFAVVKIILSEAVRLVRKFSSRQAASYINVVLDQFCRQVGILGDSSQKEL